MDVGRGYIISSSSCSAACSQPCKILRPGVVQASRAPPVPELHGRLQSRNHEDGAPQGLGLGQRASADKDAVGI